MELELFDFPPSPPPEPEKAKTKKAAPAAKKRARAKKSGNEPSPAAEVKTEEEPAKPLESGPPPPAPEKTGDKPLTVSELTRRVRQLLENSIGSLWVRGEISNCRRQSSGHYYFTLKDGGAQLSCVLFRGNAAGAESVLVDGFEIQAFGDITVYEARGQYQMIVRRARAAGQGGLQAQFEALKLRLQAEGLFDAANKRPIPRLPRAVAIVTSPTGAALQDMLNVLGRRAPWLRVLVFPARVQGAGAAEEIAAALRRLSERPDTLPEIDTVVVARGGGSLEDLWAFNEEIVARAIYECSLPVISAVGHEIDFTIADFVADLRAPTPSAAAELLAPDRAELLGFLQNCRERMQRRVGQTLEHHRRVLDLMARGVPRREPERLLLPWRQALDERAEALRQNAAEALNFHRETLTRLRHRLELRRPDRQLAERSARLDVLGDRLRARTEAALRLAETGHRRVAALLRALGPDAVLSRGFSLTLDENGHPVLDAATLKPGAELTTRLARGEVKSVVRETRAD